MSAADLFMAAAWAVYDGDEPGFIDSLVGGVAAYPKDVAALEIGRVLECRIAHAWTDGWQPADVARVVDRMLGKGEAALVRRLIAAQAVAYAELGAKVAPGWMAQIERISANHPAPTPGRPWVLGVGSPWIEVVRDAVNLMARLMVLPPLPRLVDPPAAWRDSPVIVGGSLPQGILDKVRALLAKAESTTFDSEAEACTAKAQELMARYRIDRAVVAARGGGDPREKAVGRRIGIEDPYADAKSLLLAGIADANGCRAVWSRELGFSTVFGFPGELDAVEELFTSLLVQASAAIRREGTKVDYDGRSRTTRFRRSFLVAFANRISHRLRETVDATVEAATTDTGTALVPLLTARTEAADSAASEAFPDMKTFCPSATDREGWLAGTWFGDRADLALGPELPRQTA